MAFCLASKLLCSQELVPIGDMYNVNNCLSGTCPHSLLYSPPCAISALVLFTRNIVCASGGMVDALVLGTSRVTCGGSSPLLRTVCFLFNKEIVGWSFWKRIPYVSNSLTHNKKTRSCATGFFDYWLLPLSDKMGRMLLCSSVQVTIGDAPE